MRRNFLTALLLMPEVSDRRRQERWAHEALSNCRPASNGEAGRRFVSTVWFGIIVTVEGSCVQAESTLSTHPTPPKLLQSAPPRSCKC